MPANFRVTRWLLRGLILGFLSINSAHINANTLYVTDHIRIRLFQDKSLISPVLMTLESGAKVTEITRHQNLIQVKTATDTIGWVRGEYLRQVPPAALQLNRIIPEMELMEQQLTAIKTKLAQTEAASGGIVGQSPTSNAQPQGSVAQPTTTKILDNMQRLVDQNQTLRSYIGDLEQRLMILESEDYNSPAGYPVQSKFAGGLGDFYRTTSHWRLWHWVLVLAILLSLVGIGGWLGAWQQHHQHLSRDQLPNRHQNSDEFRRF